MDPIQAARLGVDPNEIQITSSAKYRGDWIVWVPDEERGKIILTSHKDLYKMCWWKAQLRLLVAH